MSHVIERENRLGQVPRCYWAHLRDIGERQKADISQLLRFESCLPVTSVSDLSNALK